MCKIVLAWPSWLVFTLAFETWEVVKEQNAAALESATPSPLYWPAGSV